MSIRDFSARARDGRAERNIDFLERAANQELGRTDPAYADGVFVPIFGGDNDKGVVSLDGFLRRLDGAACTIGAWLPFEDIAIKSVFRGIGPDGRVESHAFVVTFPYPGYGRLAFQQDESRSEMKEEEGQEALTPEETPAFAANRTRVLKAMVESYSPEVRALIEQSSLEDVDAFMRRSIDKDSRMTLPQLGFMTLAEVFSTLTDHVAASPSVSQVNWAYERLGAALDFAKNNQPHPEDSFLRRALQRVLRGAERSQSQSESEAPAQEEVEAESENEDMLTETETAAKATEIETPAASGAGLDIEDAADMEDVEGGEEVEEDDIEVARVAEEESPAPTQTRKRYAWPYYSGRV